ncbi:unnamed protein product, partial [Staurois parvus]
NTDWSAGYIPTWLLQLPPHWPTATQAIPPSVYYLTNRSVTAAPLCQSLHRPLLGVLHPSLPIPSQTSARCPTPLCQSLHRPPLGVPPLSANPFTDLR